MLADDANTLKHLDFLHSVVRLMGFRSGLVENVLETAKNFLVR